MITMTTWHLVIQMVNAKSYHTMHASCMKEKQNVQEQKQTLMVDFAIGAVNLIRSTLTRSSVSTDYTNFDAK